MALQAVTALSTITLSSNALEVTFSSIPSFYRDLTLVVSGATAASMRPVLRINGDSGANYSFIQLADGYSSVGSGTFLDPIQDFSITNRFSQIWQIVDANSSNKHKNLLVRTNQYDGAHVHLTVGRWASNFPVSSLTMTSNTGQNYSAGTVFSLYGRVA